LWAWRAAPLDGLGIRRSTLRSKTDPPPRFFRALEPGEISLSRIEFLPHPATVSMAEPALRPEPFVLGLLGLVMVTTLVIGLVHALDPHEETGVRWIGSALAALSLSALIATVHAGLSG
jgi:hypothetical protein